jgi:hypothetical protein
MIGLGCNYHIRFKHRSSNVTSADVYVTVTVEAFICLEKNLVMKFFFCTDKRACKSQTCLLLEAETVTNRIFFTDVTDCLRRFVCECHTVQNSMPSICIVKLIEICVNWWVYIWAFSCMIVYCMSLNTRFSWCLKLATLASLIHNLIKHIIT